MTLDEAIADYKRAHEHVMTCDREERAAVDALRVAQRRAEFAEREAALAGSRAADARQKLMKLIEGAGK